jgi:cell division transport system permease protein
LAEVVRENIEIQVNLKENISPSAIDSVQKMIALRNYVLVKNNSPQINFVSKEEAAKEFSKIYGDDITKTIDENPMLNSYLINIKEEFFNEPALKRIKTDLEKIPGVFEANFPQNFVDELNKNISSFYIYLSCFVLLFLGIIIVLVNNTIKLSLYSQRMLIRSMKLVGATNQFIRSPFVQKGCLQGLFSGVLASSLLLLSAILVQKNIPEFQYIYDLNKMIILIIILLILGTLVGVVSTFYSIEKYLKQSLDDLYK